MPGGKSLADLFDFVMNFAGDLNGIAVRLAIDVQQNRWFAIGGDHGVHRFHARAYSGNIADAYRNSRRSVLDDGMGDFVRRADLPIHQSEIELMILLQQAGRVDQIRPAHRIEYVGDGHARGQQLCGVGHDLELRLLDRPARSRWKHRPDD